MPADAPRESVRTETTETWWQNVYANGSVVVGKHATRERCDVAKSKAVRRIAVEEVTTITRIARHPVPEEG